MFYLLIFHVYHWLCFLFRDGVSESQFNQVLNIELDQIIKVLLPTHFPNCLNWSGKLNCWTVWTSKLYDLFSLFFILFLQAFRHLDKEEELPKFTVLVAQKNHHTKLFQAGSTENVPPGLHLSLNCDVPNPIKVFHWPHLMVDRCSHFSFVKMIWIYFFLFVIFLQELWLTLRLFILETMISTCVLMLESLWVLHLWLKFPASHSFRNNLGRTLE